MSDDIIDIEDEPIPLVPWAERTREMRRIRLEVGEYGFVQAFLSVMAESEKACRVVLTAKEKPKRPPRCKPKPERHW